MARSFPAPHPGMYSATRSSSPSSALLPELEDRHRGERLSRGVPEHHVVGTEQPSGCDSHRRRYRAPSCRRSTRSTGRSRASRRRSPPRAGRRRQRGRGQFRGEIGGIHRARRYFVELAHRDLPQCAPSAQGSTANDRGISMRTFTNDSRSQGPASFARASYACVMPATAWEIPTILVVTNHKRQPRRHRVTSP